jgi:hypothetical protein
VGNKLEKIEDAWDGNKEGDLVLVDDGTFEDALEGSIDGHIDEYLGAIEE